mgnify:CR=1 FL=1
MDLGRKAKCQRTVKARQYNCKDVQYKGKAIQKSSKEVEVYTQGLLGLEWFLYNSLRSSIICLVFISAAILKDAPTPRRDA